MDAPAEGASEPAPPATQTLVILMVNLQELSHETLRDADGPRLQGQAELPLARRERPHALVHLVPQVRQLGGRRVGGVDQQLEAVRRQRRYELGVAEGLCEGRVREL